MSAPRQVIPLSERKIDIVIIVIFIFFSLFSFFIDSTGVFAPAGVAGHPTITPEYAQHSIWPPPWCVTNLVLTWCDRADPLVCVNPVWLKGMGFASLFAEFPYYLVAIFAIIKGKDWIRIPSLLCAICLFYSLSVIIGEEIWGQTPSTNKIMFFAAYALYWIVAPGLLFYRFGFNAHPFTRPAGTPLKKKD